MTVVVNITATGKTATLLNGFQLFATGVTSDGIFAWLASHYYVYIIAGAVVVILLYPSKSENIEHSINNIVLGARFLLRLREARSFSTAA